jgi:hypothetical protein
MPPPHRGRLGRRGSVGDAMAPEFGPELGLLLACARKTLRPADADRILGLCRQPLDWALFLRLVARHRVAPLVRRSLESTGYPSMPDQVRGALGQGEDCGRMARAALLERRDTLLSILGDLPWVTPTVPEGATFTLARLGQGADDVADDVALCRDLVIRAGVVTVPGSAFGPRGAGWVRFSFGNLPVDQLQQAGERLRQFDPEF